MTYQDLIAELQALRVACAQYGLDDGVKALSMALGRLNICPRDEK